VSAEPDTPECQLKSCFEPESPGEPERRLANLRSRKRIKKKTDAGQGMLRVRRWTVGLLKTGILFLIVSLHGNG
jgi:hypothetical protein